jgi:hypothetical protein
LLLIRKLDHSELRLATLELERGHYLDWTSLMALIPDPNRTNLWAIVRSYQERFAKAYGSSHNHQAWEGGYWDHVAETMNLACQLYRTLSSLRKLPFALHEALEVMFLHDIEKPFKVKFKEKWILKTCDCLLNECNCFVIAATKEARKELRANLISQFHIKMKSEQLNALEYVEGVPDSKYTPGERTMGELAAFCHCCDILSARLWHDKGADVPAPAWE